MLISICLLVFLLNVEAFPRVRRQYWNDSPYFQGARYYDQSAPYWNTYQQSYQVYYPQQTGYQGNWQYSQQSSYVTAPPQPAQYLTPRPNGYARPDYLQTRPTLPVVIERTTQYVTPRPLPSDRHPTFLERVISSGLPVASSTSTDGFFDREELPTREGFFESSEIDSTTELSTTEPSTTEFTTESTTITTTAETVTENTTESVTTEATTVTTTTELLTTTEEVTTATTTPQTTTERETTTTPVPSTTKESQPVTLVATQNLDDSNENQIDSDVAKTVFETATGVVGLRPPPLPKSADPDEGDEESSGVEVVKWSDSDKKL